MLFKAYPGKDIIKVIWMIPARELWGQFKTGNVTENKTVQESIIAFTTNREALEAKEDDDLDDVAIDTIYRQISRNSKPFKKI